MKLTVVLVLFATFLASVFGHVVIERSAKDARCDTLPGTIQITGEITCDALFYRYTYIKDSNSCVQFIYGGCGGTANNFQSEADCESICKQ